jgi:hypothetical protein
MYFGCILSYTNGGGASMHPNIIPWRSKILTWFNIMTHDFQNVFSQLIEAIGYHKCGLTNTPQSRLRIFCPSFLKAKEFLWPHVPEFTRNGDMWFICYNPFGPKGAWWLGTYLHMYHPQCLITLKLGKRRWPICTASFHWKLYEQFNFHITMPTH